MNPSDEHWWGFAALPPDTAYPYSDTDCPMSLVCQFHLDEGLLSVFADLDYFFGDLDAPSGHIGEWPNNLFQVLFSPDRNNLREHEIRYEDGSPAVMTPEPLDAPLQRGEESYILHAPTVWQDELTQDYPNWQVLVQLDESDLHNLRFYDCGTLFFLIRPEDLEARRFDDVKCVLYSY